MPTRSIPFAVDPDLTPEEITGAHRSDRFDEVIDDEADDKIEVICRRPNPDAEGKDDKYIDIQLARPSRAFYFGDGNVYRQELQRFSQAEQASVLAADQFGDNASVFRDLKRACGRGFVLPFVGAGMSASVGLPDWQTYLLSKCEAANLDPVPMKQRLEDGAYEQVMAEIVEALTPAVFKRNFELDFALPDELTGALSLLPKLFDGCAITTNYDRVLEQVYAAAGRGFVDKCTGRGNHDAFLRSIPGGERYLLKLHGNIDNASERILERGEYDAAYGTNGDINMSRPLPRLLDRLFSSYSLLFLGSSLAADRTIQTFMRVVSDRRAETLPRHYAIMPSPEDEDEHKKVDQRLADANITPLWYPEDEHDRVEQILQCLLD